MGDETARLAQLTLIRTCGFSVAAFSRDETLGLVFRFTSDVLAETERPSRLSFDLPAPGVLAVVRVGDRLMSDWCTATPLGGLSIAPHVVDRWYAVSGHIDLDLDMAADGSTVASFKSSAVTVEGPHGTVLLVPDLALAGFPFLYMLF